MDYLKPKDYSRRESLIIIGKTLATAAGLEFLVGATSCSKKTEPPSKNQSPPEDHLNDYLKNLADEDP